MPDKVIHICTNCGYKPTKWFGQCYSCKEWGTLVERVDQKIAKSIPRMSKKAHSRQRQLTEVKKKISAKATKDNRYFCWGCGGVCSGTLSHAHLIAESQDEDNRLNPYNIWLMKCGSSDSCHDRWGSGVIEEMVKVLAFEEILKRVKRMNKPHYNSIVLKLNDKKLNKWNFKYVGL